MKEKPAINEQEAIKRLDKKLRLEGQIELKKLEQKKQAVINNEVEQNALRSVVDAIDKEDRARIRASKSYVRLDEQISELQGKSDARSLRMLADLEKKKAGKLDLILTDKARLELEEISVERTSLIDGTKKQLFLLDERLKFLQQEELKAKEEKRKT